MLSGGLDDIPIWERVFCNRSLNMSSIKAVGFDMDYTLALYKPETFEKLAYEETLKKLVEAGYPKEIIKWKFDHTYLIRGLVIDKMRGNVLKMDRHRYVKVAYHGFKELTRDERRKLYDVENVIAYEEPNFALIDTIFSLAEAFLFIQLVDYKDHANKIQEKSYLEMYNDVRRSIDLCHRDQSIKSKVAANPLKYIYYDKYIFPLFEEIRDSGRQLFIVTNSLWDYTNILMDCLYKHGKSASEITRTWYSYFDVIITGSQKPGFFMSKNPLYQVDLDTGLLKNIDLYTLLQDKNKTIPKVFQGGHSKLLYDLLKIKMGSQLLYVGDHIYGDILRSKKEIGWRTMLVIEELEKEIIAFHSLKESYDNCEKFNSIRMKLEDDFERMQIALKSLKNGKDILLPQLKHFSEEELEKQVKKIGYDLVKIREQEKKEIHNYHKGFHHIWGELMKTGRQNSRFAAQVENYACLYTSKLANLRHYGFHKNYSAVRDFMPHDLEE